MTEDDKTLLPSSTMMSGKDYINGLILRGVPTRDIAVMTDIPWEIIESIRNEQAQG